MISEEPRPQFHDHGQPPTSLGLPVSLTLTSLACGNTKHRALNLNSNALAWVRAGVVPGFRRLRSPFFEHPERPSAGGGPSTLQAPSHSQTCRRRFGPSCVTHAASRHLTHITPHSRVSSRIASAKMVLAEATKGRTGLLTVGFAASTSEILACVRAPAQARAKSATMQ